MKIDLKSKKNFNTYIIQIITYEKSKMLIKKVQIAMCIYICFSLYAYGSPPDIQSFKSSDDYAKYVLEKHCFNIPMPQEMIVSESYNFLAQLKKSRDEILDVHTKKVLKNLVLKAIQTSPTFQRLVLFAIQNNKEPLSTITYRNFYEPRNDEPFSVLTPSDILDFSEKTINIVIRPEHGEDQQGPYVNISVAPNEDSEQFGHYQAGVIHEIIHALTDSGDPSNEESNSKHGPTELLTELIIQELKIPYSIYKYGGYHNQKRIDALELRNYISLRDLITRNDSKAEQILRNLIKISKKF